MNTKSLRADPLTQSLLLKLLTRKPLQEKESFRFFDSLFTSGIEDSRAKSILILQSHNGVTEPELTGCYRALRQYEPEKKFPGVFLMDTCGTGGDGSHSINISSLVAIVLAAQGVKVAKHGNKGLTSKCGSSDLFSALGVNIHASEKRMREAIQKCGLGYFHAPLYHPIFSKVQPLRQKIKSRTIFNLLGPLVNPFRLSHQLVGVSRPEYLELYAGALKTRKLRKAIVLHSEDGMDEASLSAPTHLYIVTGKTMKRSVVKPWEHGLPKASPEKIRGGSANHNARIAKDLLQNRLKGPKRDMVVLNAGIGLLACEKVKTLKEGIRASERAISSGMALTVLKHLIQISNQG